MNMCTENNAMFAALGITDAYRSISAGGIACTFERFHIPANMQNNVVALWQDQFPLPADNSHGYYTAATFLQAAPNATLYQLPPSHTIDAQGNVSGFLVDTVLPWILENKPTVLFSALDVGTGLDSIYDQIKDFCAVFASTGNDSNNSAFGIIQDKNVYGVGAVQYSGGAFTQTGYTSITPDVDFASVGDLYAPDTTGGSQHQTGTSFAAPLLAGMIFDLQMYLKQQTGRTMPSARVYKFIKENCMDMLPIGYDTKTGYGIFKLPPISDVEPYKLLGKVVTMKIGETNFTVNGSAMTMDQAPYINPETGRTLVPARAMAEAFGYRVTWDPATQEITFVEP